MTVAAVLAPGKRPFTVGKPAKVLDINDFHFSSGPLNERLLGETAQQHGITVTGVLHPCGRCLEAKGCLLYTSPSPRDGLLSRMPSSA